MAKRRLLLILLVFALLAGACSGDDDGGAGEESDDDGAANTANTGGAGGTVGGVRNSSPGAVTVRLSQGEALTAVTAPTVAKVDGTPLDSASIGAVLDRLPPWLVDETDKADFNRPAESITPPRTGDTIDVTFPVGVDDAPPVVDPGPLEVLRVQPEGSVGIAPFVSLTFNQPMVPLGTLAQLDDLDVPVTITPEPPGRWQWIGTRTLRFEHDPDVFDRLPMATSYVVEVPAGATSESGDALTETFRFEFETPPPSVIWLSPQDDSIQLEPIFLATFDQRVDPVAVLATVSLTADGQGREIRLATDNEIDGDEIVRPRAEAALDGAWVAFRAVDPFQPDQGIEIRVGPDVPSAEGPNTKSASSTFRARTYAPLRVEGHSCERANECRPGRSLDVWFNNTLDPDSLDVADVVIEPELAGGARISVRFNQVTIAGGTVGGTEYEMSIPGSLTDEFGQALGDDQTITFEIGHALPQIRQYDRIIATADPLADGQTIPVAVRNHDRLRVRLFEVDPDDWTAYTAYYDVWQQRWDEPLPAPPWPASYDEVVDTGADDDVLTEVRVDVQSVLSGDPGHVVMIVEGVGRFATLTPDDNDFWDNRPLLTWVQATSLGVDMVRDSSDVAVWVTDLRTGEPVADVDIELVGQQQQLSTGNDGLARASIGGDGFELIVATLGDDTAVLAVSGHRFTPEDQEFWYVVDDRNLYRPGEAMRVKGWVRNIDFGDDATLEFLPSGELITYRVADSFDSELAAGELRLDEHGGFDFEADLPLGANLGFAWISFRRPGTPGRGGFTHQFQIEEFRRPEFEVTARAETPGPYFVDEPATVAVDATYFSGGPLPDAEVDWTVWTMITSYSPPSWDEFTFGIWTPWWVFDNFGGRGFFGGFDGGFDDSFFFPGPQQDEPERFEGVTDRSGTHFLRMDFDGDGEGLPTTVSAQAQVIDVNRQAWTSTTDVLVHPADLYVGLRSTRTFVRAGEPLDVEAIVTDIDGGAVSGRTFTLTAERLVHDYVDGAWTEVGVEAETCEVTSGDGPVSCTFAVANGGRYRISAEVTDDAGRHSRSEMTRWVTGGDSVPNRNLELETIELVPDKREYAAGDTAEILVSSPFSPATGLLTISRGDVVEISTFDVVDHAAVIEIPITDAHVPNLTVQVELVGTTERSADDGTTLPDVPDRPAYATGTLELRVPPFSRTLNVSAEPAQDTIEPGASTSIAVEVTDAAGDPVAGADVLLVVVDEAVLALSGYELIDPIDVFYRSIFANVGVFRGRDSILLADPEELIALYKDLASTTFPQEAEGESVPGGDSADDADASSVTVVGSPTAAFSRNALLPDAGGGQIEVRKNFDALAVFDADVTTGVDGTATVDFVLPDNLTRYRVMAVAVDGVDRFGKSESNLTARLPLQVRPSAPRFLNFGDSLELPLVVQNLTDADMHVDVVLQTSNLKIDGPSGRRVTVPANNRIEVRFAAHTESAGTARFRAAVVSAEHEDAAVVSLPVFTPATSEAFATYGVIDDGAIVQSLLAPTDVFPQFGGLEVNTSSTALQALTDAVIYLAEYPYRSSDAYASRIIAISALKDVLEAFEAEGLPSAAELDAVVRSDITNLSALQNFDGGFGWWFRDQQSSPFQSIQAMHALVVAIDNGYSVSPQVMDNGRLYLRDIENRIPQNYSRATKDMLAAYALHVRRLDGDRDSAKARALWNRRGAGLGLDALAWIWPVVDNDSIEADILRVFNNAVTETPSGATFATDYGEDAYLILHSSRRTDGIVLDALIAMAPDSDLIVKTVNGLLGNQIRGRWNNVQENSFILLAMKNYFDTFEAVEPDFVAQVWLGDLYAFEHEFSGRETDRAETLVPMAELFARGDDDLIVAKDGEGRLYYRLGLRYAPTDLDLDPLDRGFVVQRSYEAIDDPSDVSQDADGAWHIKTGSEVRVRLTMVNDSRRTNMALVDAMPAGLESLNPALATTGRLPRDDAESGDAWWRWTWYEHQNLRDGRAEAFSSYLWAGTHQYSYIARATTPGTFIVPPARAEEIYAPEVFGRSGSDVVVIED